MGEIHLTCLSEPMGDAVIPLYTAPPAPVVPKTLPCSVELKPGLIIGKGCKTETLLTALRRRAEYYAKLEAMTPEEREKHGASIEAFKAMLPQPAPVDKEFIPKNLDKALGVVGVALPESKEEFNFQIERWIQRLIDRVIRYADEFKEQPAPVVPDEMATSDDMNLYQKSFAQGYNACRAAMLQGGQPVSQTYNLPELIEGMEVSVGVSTCDFDAGHRYFGTVTEISELYTAKNGYILLVQDAKPNFDVNGNSPVIPDGWISCSERMPDREYVLAGDFSGTHYLASIPNVQVGIYADWFDDEKPCWDDGDGNDLHLKEVTHWMPLPEPPQEVK
ncbi:DUF551 domain-containing protein [Salmonella enterica]|nr:DUF551 domain-containing protein [Salmonella enterica]